jgi:hypothetical protein
MQPSSTNDIILSTPSVISMPWKFKQKVWEIGLTLQFTSYAVSRRAIWTHPLSETQQGHVGLGSHRLTKPTLSLKHSKAMLGWAVTDLQNPPSLWNTARMIWCVHLCCKQEIRDTELCQSVSSRQAPQYHLGRPAAVHEQLNQGQHSGNCWGSITGSS